jgi:lysophospholipase L1-like esterase
MGKSIKRGILNVVFFLFLALLISILLELITRVYFGLRQSTGTIILTGDDRIYDHRPLITFTNKYGFRIHYNSLGFIGDEIGEKKKGTFRILGLGDSVTDASYLPEKERYLSVLEETLSHRLHKPVEVINGAVSGYNSWQELALLKNKGLKIKPDLVIVGICLNDSVKLVPLPRVNWLGGITAKIRDGSKARYGDFLYQRSDFYKLAYDFLYNLRKGGLSDKDFRRYAKGYRFSINVDEMEEWKAVFREMLLLAKGHNTKILFVIFPLQGQVIRGEEFSCRGLSDLFRDNKAYCLDLIGSFRLRFKNGEPLFKRRDLLHPTSLGHRIAAESIADFIISQGILN